MFKTNYLLRFPRDIEVVQDIHFHATSFPTSPLQSPYFNFHVKKRNLRTHFAHSSDNSDEHTLLVLPRSTLGTSFPAS